MYGKPLLRCNDCNGEMRIVDTRVLDPDGTGRVYRKRRYKCMNCGCNINTLEQLKDMHVERLKKINKKLGVSK